MQQGKQRWPHKTNWSDSEMTVFTERVEENLDLIKLEVTRGDRVPSCSTNTFQLHP